MACGWRSASASRIQLQPQAGVLVVLQAGEGPGGVETAGRTGGALPALINILAGSPVLGQLETLGTGAVGLALGTVATVGTLNITSGHLGIYYLVHRQHGQEV